MTAVRAIWDRRARGVTLALAPTLVPAVLVAVAIAAVGGWVLAGRLTAQPAATAPQPPRTVHLAATAQITLRAGWRPLLHAPAVPGLGAGARAYAPGDGSPGQLVVALNPQDGVPAATLGALRVPLGAATRTKLAGRSGVAYSALSLRGVQGLTDLYSIPTAAGTLTVACVAPLSDPLPAGSCPGDVLSISAWTPDDGLGALHAQAPAIAHQLDRARVTDRAALQHARTPAGQVHAAARLAAAYGAAARAVHRSAPAAGDAALPRALAAAAAAYDQLSAAAARRDRHGWRRARQAVYGAEHAVAAALRS